MDILSKIQTELNAPKNQRNNFGNYNYRSCEDILEGLKPLLQETNTSVILSDDIKMVGDRIYVMATAKLVQFKNSDMSGGVITIGESTAFAREPLQQKGMNEAQITGSASSYARKYALNGLFAIDDNKDADTDEHRKNSNSNPIKTKSVGDIIRDYLASDKIPQADKQSYRNDLNSKAKQPNEALLNELKSKYGNL